MNPSTKSNVGGGSQVTLVQFNGKDRQQVDTDANGAAGFDIATTDYILSSRCNSCQGDYRSNAGTQYLISPQADGTVKVLSAADETMTKDASGNYLISIVLKRTVTGSDPWQLLRNQPTVSGSPEHIYLMTNGKVLMQTRDGQGFEKWALLTPDKTGSYTSGSWTQIAQPPAGYNPQNVNGAVLHSGNFMVVGGEQNTNTSGVMEWNSNRSFTYNVLTDSWTEVAPPNNGTGDWAGIGAAPFVLLPDGRLMVGDNGVAGVSPGYGAMLYDEKTGSWSSTGENKVTANGEEGYTLLANDKVLSLWNGDDNAILLKKAEVYDPATGLWSAAASVPVILGHSEIGPALTLPSGKVLAMGATGKNALYDPIANSWSAVPDFPKLNNGLQEEAADNQAAILPNGNVLVITSVFMCNPSACYWMAPAGWFEYDVASNTWLRVADDPMTPSASMLANGTQALALPNGQIMVTSEGQTGFYTSTSKSDPSWAPVVDSISSTTLSPNVSYMLAGKQLAGLTEGSFWGDEQQNASNYGLVQIMNNTTHDVSYGRTSNFSNTSIAPNTSSTFNFSIDGSAENGASSLRVIASGLTSAPVAVTITGGVAISTPVPVVTPTPTPSPQATTPVVVKPKVVKKVIVCVKGLLTKKVTGIAPRCPVGYKIKK